MLRPSHKMSHGHPIICCFRVLKKIKVTISHLLFNTPSLSACSGPSFSPPCVLSLCLSLSPPSVVFDESTFSLCFSQSSICLSTLCLTSPHAHTHDVHINIAVGPSSHTHSSSSAHTHTHMNIQKYEHTLVPSVLTDSRIYFLLYMPSAAFLNNKLSLLI